MRDADDKELALICGACVPGERAVGRMCELAGRYGKRLAPADVARLYRAREGMLRASERIELGEGALPLLVWALCDSPHIAADEFADVLEQMLALFYELKNDCGDELTDEELAQAMASWFDECEGDMTGVMDAALTDMLRAGERSRGHERY